MCICSSVSFLPCILFSVVFIPSPPSQHGSVWVLSPLYTHNKHCIASVGLPTEYISLREMKQGQCICPLSWSVHCNFTGDGNCNKRGWACNPHPHQPSLILPSWLNVRQKADVNTLCTLWACLIKWWERFRGIQKEDDRGPLRIQSSLDRTIDSRIKRDGIRRSPGRVSSSKQQLQAWTRTISWKYV